MLQIQRTDTLEVGTFPLYPSPVSAAHPCPSPTGVLLLGFGVGPVTVHADSGPTTCISSPCPCSPAVTGVLAAGTVKNGAQGQEQGLGGDGSGGELRG